MAGETHKSAQRLERNARTPPNELAMQSAVRALLLSFAILCDAASDESSVVLQPPVEDAVSTLTALKGLHGVVDSEFARIDSDFEAEQASLFGARKAGFLSLGNHVSSPASDASVVLEPPSENAAATLAALKGLHDVVDSEFSRIDQDFEAESASLQGHKASFISSGAPDIAASMNGLASDLESGKHGDVPAAKLLGSAVSAAVGSETSRRNLVKLQSAVNAAVSKRVKQYFLSGACTRDFSSTCPIGWTYANGLCSAPAGAATPCRDLDLRNAKDHDLVQVSYVCGAEWPCK